MAYTYIFDTSALKAAGSCKIKDALIKGSQLYISPISIYELICHLDETKSGEDTFARRKGNLLKCKSFKILHDPFAHCATVIGIGNKVNPTRFEEPYVLTQLIGRLEESMTLEDFYSKTVIFTNGEIGQICNLAVKARNTFEEENDRYKKHINTLNTLCDNHIRYDTIDAKVFINFCGNNIRILNPNANDAELFKMFCSTYAYAGYKLARLFQYRKKSHKAMCKFEIDVNDTEDSFICLHLELDKPVSLVTNDGGTRDALEMAFEAYREVEGNKGANTLVAKVIKLDDFYNEVLGY